MRIFFGLCDDEQEQTAYLKMMVEEWADNRAHKIDVRIFDSAEAFLFTYDEDKRFDILLLDIQMKGMDGVSLAKRLRKSNAKTQIVFITGFTDFYAEGYEVEALHYLMKPVDAKKLFAVLDKAAARLATVERVVALPDGVGYMRIPVNDIYYAEAFSHTVALHTVSGIREYKIRITDMEQLLGGSFFRCHRSYVVNMRQVRRITRTELVLSNGASIPLARGLYDEAYRLFMDEPDA